MGKLENPITIKEECVTELLIELVQSHPPLWDANDKRFRMAPLKQKLWAEIGMALGGVDGSFVQAKWKNLRDTFVKEMKPSTTASGKKYKKAWCHFEKMMFLQHSIKPTQLNFPRQKRPWDYSLVEEADNPLDSLSITDHSISDAGGSRMKKSRDEMEIAHIQEMSYPRDFVAPLMDPDEQFFMSLVPSFKRLTPRQQAKLKVDVTKLFFETEFPDP